MITPRNVRRLSGKPFRRIATTRPGTHVQRLSQIANHARSRGYNARIVKNKTSTSVYVSRRYNAPIPETDGLRAAIFPVALANHLGSNIPLTAAGYSKEQADRIEEIYPQIVDNQRAEIEEFTQEIDEKVSNMRQKYEDILNRSQIHAGSMETPSTYDPYFSNISEDEWNSLWAHPSMQRAVASFEAATDTVVAHALAEHAYIQDAEAVQEMTRYTLEEGEFTTTLMDGGNMAVADKDGVILWTFSPEAYDRIFEATAEEIEGIMQKAFIAGMRELGYSEHSVIWSMLADDMEGDINEMKTKLQFNQWSTWDKDNSDALLAELNPPVPSMIDLPMSPEAPPQRIEDTTTEAAEAVASVVLEPYLHEITIKTNDMTSLIRSVLDSTGMNAKNELASIQGFTSAPGTGPEAILVRKSEDPMNIPGSDGKVWVKGHWRNRPNSQDTAYSARARWIRPRQRFNSNNQARDKIATYLYDMKAQGNPKINTSKIHSHLKDNMGYPPTMSQITNFLSKDKRFIANGTERVGPRNIKTWTITPPEADDS